MRIVKLFLCGAVFLALSFPCLAGGKEGGSTRLHLSVSNDQIHLYVVNGGATDLAKDYRIDSSGLGYVVNFFFYGKNGYCKECKYTPEEDFVSQMPLFYEKGDISPWEIAGVSFPLDFIAERYALRTGCYGFFATFTRRKGSAVVTRNVSNASRICVPEKAVKP